MTELQQNLRAKRSFLIILALIWATDVAILLDIPVLRELLSLPFLLILPGLMILFLLKANRLGFAETAVLTIGLSATFLMFFGYILNELSLQLGHDTPLATDTLAPSLTGMLLILTFGAYKRNKEAFASLRLHIDLNARGKLVLLLPALLPLCSVIGMFLLNTTDNNTILLVLLVGLVPTSLILLTISKNVISENTYPIALLMITVSLLSLFWLRSEHILGNDINKEYYLYHLTTLNHHWDNGYVNLLNSSGTPLGSCLSITILPAVFQSLLDVSWDEYLFKGIYVLICTFTPLVIYIIARKYLGSLYAFLAAIFFISQSIFLGTAGSPRTNLAIFFVALFIMTLFHDDIKGTTRQALFTILMAAIVVSHYSTTFLFFLILLAIFLLRLILRKYAFNGRITGITIALLAVMIFIWYSGVATGTFGKGVHFFEETIQNLTSFASEEARDPDLQQLSGKGIGGDTLKWIRWVFIWIGFLLVGAGVMGALLQHKTIEPLRKNSQSLARRLQNTFEPEYLLLSIVCCSVLAATIALPHITIDYGYQRIYSQMSIVVAPFFVVGCITMSIARTIKPYVLVLFILIPHMLFMTGAMNAVFTNHPGMMFSSEGSGAAYRIIHDHEIQSARWLQKHREAETWINTTGIYGAQKLISQGKVPQIGIDYESFVENQLLNGYLYLSYNNVIDGEFIYRHEKFDMSEYTDMFAHKNKLYTNGGTQVWR